MSDQPLGPDGPQNKPSPIHVGVNLVSPRNASLTNFPTLVALLTDCNFIEGQKILHREHVLVGKCVVSSVPGAEPLTDEENARLDEICEEIIGLLDNYSPEGHTFTCGEDEYFGWWPNQE